jgi:2-deoxy-D-gluconate 3-dehydrogenase
MILDKFKLDGKAALVTGAARGLGRAMALGLAEAGADVAVVDRIAPEETDRAIAALGRRSHALTRDLATLGPDGAHELIRQVADALGRFDILVNNAGIIRRGAALEFPRADWDEVTTLDLTVPFYLAQAAAREFVHAGHGGKVINVSSIMAFEGGLHVVSYAASKSGLAGMTRALANEWAPLGINVNAIAPGYIVTELTAALREDPERNPAMLVRMPAGRYGEPEDLQGVVVFLASEASAYVHGSVYPVDGGWLSR